MSDALDLGFDPIDLDFSTDTEVDTPEVDLEVDTPEVDGEADGETTDTDKEGSEGVKEDQEKQQDGRKAPDAVRKALKAFRESSPEHAAAAKQLNDAYGRYEAYKGVFGKVEDARAAKTTLDTIETMGGFEGVQNTIADIEEVDRLLATGDVSVIDRIAEVAGEGLHKITPALIDRLQKDSPDAYKAAIRPHVVSAIASSGLSGAFAAVLNNLDMAKTPGANDEFKQKFEKQALEGLSSIYKFLEGLGKPEETDSTSKPDTKATDALTAREKALNDREESSFRQDVGVKANPEMNQSLSKALNPYLKQLKLGEVAKQDLVQGIYEEIGKLVNADKDYQKQKDTLFKAKNRNSANIAKFISSKFDSVASQAAKNVVGRRYGKSPAAKGAPSPVKPNAQGAGTKSETPAKGIGSLESPVKVKEFPDRKDIDIKGTTDEQIARGIRKLRTGKFIQLV